LRNGLKFGLAEERLRSFGAIVARSTEQDIRAMVGQRADAFQPFQLRSTAATAVQVAAYAGFLDHGRAPLYDPSERVVGEVIGHVYPTPQGEMSPA
jgi:hypothetical protein